MTASKHHVRLPESALGGIRNVFSSMRLRRKELGEHTEEKEKKKKMCGNECCGFFFFNALARTLRADNHVFKCFDYTAKSIFSLPPSTHSGACSTKSDHHHYCRGGGGWNMTRKVDEDDIFPHLGQIFLFLFGKRPQSRDHISPHFCQSAQGGRRRVEGRRRGKKETTHAIALPSSSDQRKGRKKNTLHT